MKRREFIKLLGGAAATWPFGARAQQPKIPRIGYVTASAADDPENRARHVAFVEAFMRLGWVDGRNVGIDYRWNVFGSERIQATAAELVSLSPNVLVTQGSPNVQALQRATATIPIVFLAASDPVGSGLVKSLAHPGGNVTGFVNYEFPMGAKWLEILKEVAPDITRVLVISEPGNFASQAFVHVIEVAAPSVGVRQVLAADPRTSEFEGAMRTFANQPGGGLIVLPGGFSNRDLIVGMAARRQLPAIYASRPFIESGGLMSFDTDHIDLARRAASYVDRLLRGEKPADLPVQTPTKYELVINLKVAKALGLTVPLPLLARADEVIE
jgi:putative ABC transport system substrate-binding protein